MRKLFVKAKPHAKKERVKVIDASHFEVFVKAPPKEGKANRAILKVLSRHLSIPVSRLMLLSGRQGKQKVVGIVEK